MERRRTQRFQMAIPVELNTAAGTLVAESRNISNGGMLLQSAASLPIGTQVQMSFSVPGQDVFYPDVCFNGEGTVVRLQAMENGFGIAVACHSVIVSERWPKTPSAKYLRTP